MKRSLLVLIMSAAVLALGASPAPPCSTPDHGGRYAGPGDLLPPGGGETAPTAPTGPTQPVPTGPVTGGTTPTGVTPPGVSVTPPTSSQPIPNGVTPAADFGPDITAWVIWWEFNKDRYLNLRAALNATDPETSAGDILTGMRHATARVNAFRPSPEEIRDKVLPTIRQTLEQEENNVDLLSSCLIALGKMGGGNESSDLIARFLKHRNQEIAETAAVALGILRHAESIPILAALLADDEQGRRISGRPSGVPQRSRSFAAYGLALIGRGSGDEQVKALVADLLIRTLRTDKASVHDVRAACVIGLGILELKEPQDIATELGTYLRAGHDSRLVRAHIPGSMAKLIRSSRNPSQGSKDAVDLFSELLLGSNAENEVRQSCVQALGILARGQGANAGKIYGVLTHIAAKGKDVGEKNLTAVSLAYLASSAPVNEGWSRESLRFLMQNLDRGRTSYRPWCGLALGIAGFHAREDGSEIPPVVLRAVRERFMREKNLQHKSAYALALGLLRHEGAAPEIADSIISVSEPTYRGYAAVALGLMEARKYQDLLSKTVATSRRLPELLRQASVGLGLMRNRETLPVLLDLMFPNGGARAPLSVMAAGARAVGIIGDSRALPRLTELMQDPEVPPLSRAFGAVGLGLVSDPGPLPWNEPIAENVNYLSALPTLTDFLAGLGILDIL